MADQPNPIRCSSCGTTNPPGQDRCQTCQTPLTTAASTAAGDMSPASDDPPRSATGDEENVPETGLMAGLGGAILPGTGEQLDQDPTTPRRN